jgi:hypothetical protein
MATATTARAMAIATTEGQLLKGLSFRESMCNASGDRVWGGSPHLFASCRICLICGVQVPTIARIISIRFR